MTRIADGSGRALARNAASQVGGRVALSLGRLGAAILIVRLAGMEAFGAYVLVLQFIFIAEWLADFGQTDVAVRDIARDPAAEPAVLAALARLKLLQALALAPLLPLALLGLAYPPPIVQAGLAGAACILAHAALQPLRAWMRVRMLGERDVAAEVGGLLVMLPLTWAAAAQGLGIVALVGAYAVARLVQLGLALVFAGGWPAPLRGAGAPGLFRGAAPLGIAGLLVAFYDALATLALSKLVDLDAVAQFGAATRFVFPVIIAIQALVSAFAAPLSAAWRSDPGRLRQLQQSALDTAVMAAGLMFCGAFAAAPFLLGLLGPGMRGAAPVMQLLCLVVLVRAVNAAMTPLLLVGGRQGRTLWLTALAVAAQALALAVLTPRFGLIGAAAGYLLVELCVSVVPIAILAQRAAGIRVDWRVPLRLVACALGTVVAVGLLPIAGSLAAGILAGAVYILLLFATRTVPVALLRQAAAGFGARRATPIPGRDR